MSCRFVSRRGCAALAAAFLLTADRAQAQFEPHASVRRLGHLHTYLEIDDDTRPVLDASVSRHTFAIEDASPRVIELAVTSRGSTNTARDSRRCRVVFSPANSAEREIATFEEPGRDSWTKIHALLPAAPDGATLGLMCDEGAAVVWARPVLLPATRDEREPLIVVLSLDTLRADHVAGFGAPPGSTPALGRLVKEGFVFSNAVSPSPWTLPAHFSLFYSRLYGFAPDVVPITGLAGTLAEAGFATAGFHGGGFVDATFVMNLGFDRYTRYGSGKYGSELKALPPLLADARQWIDEHASTPSFVFLHTYAVHEIPARESVQSSGGLLRDRMTREFVAPAREFYRELVKKLDSALTPFLAGMREIARTRPTMLIVLSDHGEAFGEHANFRHGIGSRHVTLHDELVRIPMIIWAPGIVPPDGAASYPFSLVDVAPTLLASTGIAQPASMIGRNFWPLVGNRTDRFQGHYQSMWNKPVVSYKDFGAGAPAAWSIRSGSHKRIVQQADGAPPANVEIYDLIQDPGERNNLARVPGQSVLDESVAEIRRRLVDLEVVNATRADTLPICPSCELEDVPAFWNTIAPPSGSAGTVAESLPVSEGPRERLRELGYLE